MSDTLVRAARNVFAYPSKPLLRRHGPRGYVDYKSFKPWLRDEFNFCCWYCRCRERWEPNGQDVFSVEHVLPRSRHPQRLLDYDNLIYACSTCNSSRQDEPLPFDLQAEAMAGHLHVRASGEIEAVSREAEQLIRICHLDRPSLTQFRHDVLELVEALTRIGNEGTGALQRLLKLPDDLPNRCAKRPPGGNDRPEGLDESWHANQERGHQPGTY